MSTTMDDADVLFEVSGSVATITLARAARRNAIGSAFAARIADAFARAAGAGARITILRSAGPVFCAGVDLTEPVRLDAGSPELVVAEALLGSGLYVVTAVEGPVLAGGLLLIALSPVVIASESASLWLPERSIGIFPSRVLAYLEEIVPARRAHGLGLTEERLDARHAQELGLVTEVVGDGEMETRLAATTAELTEASPAFLAAARDTWAARFRSASFRERRDAYDRILADNLSGTQLLPR